MKKIVCAIALCALLFTGSPAGATLVFFEGFEGVGPPWGWAMYLYDPRPAFNYGTVTRAASGDNGITSKSGNYHAVFTGGYGGNPETGGNFGPGTYYDGKRYYWPGGFTTSLDIYLDTSWGTGTGFGYDVAVSGTGPSPYPVAHFFFNVTKDTSTGDLIVAATDWTNFYPLENLEQYANHSVVGASGWYTFRHVFYEEGGYLAVLLTLLDESGSIVFTDKFDGQYPINTVGGNRYGLFAYMNVPGGLAVDNTSLEVVPIPPAAWLLGSGLLGLVVIRRRVQK